jgi:nitronate monooxygenase
LQEEKGKPVVPSGGIGNGQAIREALLAGASAAMLGTRFVTTIESNAHPVYKKALLPAYVRNTALTVCFQDGWPALHRALRSRTRRQITTSHQSNSKYANVGNQD